MPAIRKPLPVPELDLRPEQASPVRLSEDMQQVLALLTGYARNQRVLLQATPSGVLFVASPRIEDIFHVTATSDNYTYQGVDKACSDVVIMGHPDNTGLIWARPDLPADSGNAYPLAKKEAVCFTLSNLNQLYLLIVTNGEKAIVVYNR